MKVTVQCTFVARRKRSEGIVESDIRRKKKILVNTDNVGPACRLANKILINRVTSF